MTKPVLAYLMSILFLIASLSQAAGKEARFLESDPKIAEFREVVSHIFAEFSELGPCRFVKQGGPEAQDDPSKPVFGECDMPEVNLCASDAGKRRCFSGRVLAWAFGADFNSKGTKCKVKWNAYIHDGNPDPVVLVQFIYKFSKRDGGWTVASKKQGIVFDLPQSD